MGIFNYSLKASGDSALSLVFFSSLGFIYYLQTKLTEFGRTIMQVMRDFNRNNIYTVFKHFNLVCYTCVNFTRAKYSVDNTIIFQTLPNTIF